MSKIQYFIIGLSLSLLLSYNFLFLGVNAQNTESSLEEGCFDVLVRADELYQQNEEEAKEEAIELYKQCKDEFIRETGVSPLDVINTSDDDEIPIPIYDADELERGQNLWANAQDGLARGTNSKGKAYFSLVALMKIAPEFIPAYMALADFCIKEAEFCEKSAKSDQPKSASEVLERATELYPDDADLLTKKIEFLAQEEKYLQASIAARQFAIVYDDHPEAEKFNKLADDYLWTFQREINQQLTSQAVLTLIGGAFTAWRGNNPYAPIRGIQMIGLLAQGESGFGKQSIDVFANNARGRNELVEDPVIVEYIEGIAGRITPYMGRDFEYEYYVVNNPSINAFALPGGKIVIYTGAIMAADSESEIAGLLGHEIAHAVLSHGYLKVIQANFIGGISDVFGSVGQLNQVKSLVDYMSPILNASYSREFERQSDILGARTLALAGYSADGLRDFMLKLKAQSGNRQTTYLDSHPAPSDRVQYLEEMIVNNGYERYTYMGVKKHQDIKNRLANPNQPMPTPSNNNQSTPVPDPDTQNSDPEFEPLW